MKTWIIIFSFLLPLFVYSQNNVESKEQEEFWARKLLSSQKLTGNFSIEQEGIGNETNINQEENLSTNVNTVSVAQIGNFNFLGSSYKDVFLLFSEQIGDHNKVEFSQVDFQNEARFIQHGSINTIQIEQGGIGVMDIFQEGTNNVVEAKHGNYDIFSEDNLHGIFLTIDQHGNNNQLRLSASGNVSVLQSNYGTIMNGNKIDYYQTGKGEGRFAQVGDENELRLTQGGSGTISILQKGNQNKIAGNEDILSETLSEPEKYEYGEFEGAKLIIDQLGDRNLMQINSTGTSNMAGVMQNGNDNKAYVIQN